MIKEITDRELIIFDMLDKLLSNIQVDYLFLRDEIMDRLEKNKIYETDNYKAILIIDDLTKNKRIKIEKKY